MTFNTVKTIKPCIISSEYETGAHSWRVQRSRFPLQRLWSISACSKNIILPDWSCCDDLKNQYSDNWFVTWVSDVFRLIFKLPGVFQRSLVNVIPDWFKHPGSSSTQMMDWQGWCFIYKTEISPCVLKVWFFPPVSLLVSETRRKRSFFVDTTAAAACQPADGLLRVRAASPSDAQTGNLPDITVEINGSLFKYRRMNQLLSTHLE